MVETLNLAKRYYNDEEYGKAYPIIIKLANDNNMDAIKLLYEIFLYGHGVEKNIKTAYNWYKKLADNNIAEAQYYYGWYLLEQHQYENGIAYLFRAHDNRYIDATYDIAGLYAYGDYGFQQNITKSISFYEKACLRGKKIACKDLYIAYKNLTSKKEATKYILNNFGLLKFLKLRFFG